MARCLSSAGHDPFVAAMMSRATSMRSPRSSMFLTTLHAGDVDDNSPEYRRQREGRTAEIDRDARGAFLFFHANSVSTPGERLEPTPSWP